MRPRVAVLSELPTPYRWPVFAGLLVKGVPATWRRTPRDGEAESGD